jgi:hypothetical protein
MTISPSILHPVSHLPSKIIHSSLSDSEISDHRAFNSSLSEQCGCSQHVILLSASLQFISELLISAPLRIQKSLLIQISSSG